MKHLKLFENWLNESESQPLFNIDLQKELPKEFNRASRLQDEDDDEEYTNDITTTLKVYDASDENPKEIPNLQSLRVHIHDSFEKEPNKIKLDFEDYEGGYGNYGAYGGGHEVTVYAGLKKLDKKSVLDFFKSSWKNDDWWGI
jgi:hypothetical protein